LESLRLSGPAATLGAALPHLQLYLNVRAVLHYLHDAYRGSDGDSNGQSSVKSSRILAFRLRNSIFNEIVHWMLGSFMFPPSASAWGTMVVSLLQLVTDIVILGHAGMQLTYKSQSALMK